MTVSSIRSEPAAYGVRGKTRRLPTTCESLRKRGVRKIFPEDLAHIPLVLREYGSGTLDVIELALAKNHIRFADLQILMYLGSTESIKLFLQHADCMGIVSVRSIQNELTTGKLQIVEIEQMSMLRQFDFVQLQGIESGLSQLFIRFAQQ